MSNKDMGGAAFPQTFFNTLVSLLNAEDTQDMKLWDYYAAAALPAIISGVMEARCTKTKDGKPITEEALAEQTAYFADAMLAERKKRMEQSNEY